MNASRQLGLNQNYPINSFIDLNGSDATLSGNGNLFSGNAGCDTFQDDYLHQKDGPQIDIKDDELPDNDLEDHSFGIDDH